ncbi:hypothetical protein V6N11_037407 [Hibiscus sabdariffa]|uniref:Uncharacterized protein n=1 Tax=Hibiscus sabdariffa TaxID=183260 RepID=A0ABR2P1I0_9ROSI
MQKRNSKTFVVVCCHRFFHFTSDKERHYIPLPLVLSFLLQRSLVDIREWPGKVFCLILSLSYRSFINDLLISYQNI